MKFYRYRRFNSEDDIYTYKENGTEKTFKENPVTAELKNGVVVFSYPTDFNDPYDCALVLYPKDIDKYLDENRDELVDLIKNSLKDTNIRFGLKKIMKPLQKREINELKNAKDYKKYLKDIFECRGVEHDPSNFYVDLRWRVKIACFTPILEEVLMWSYYADSHKGYCIEYEIPEDDEKTKLYKVNYVDELPNVTKIINRENPKLIVEIACEKAKCWEHENEYRGIIFKYTNQEIQNTEKISEYFDFKQYITAVYIGAKASEKNIKRIIEIAKDETFNVYKMELSEYAYKLKPKLLNIESAQTD